MSYQIFDSLCKEHGISPTRAALNAGVDQSTISNWKAGKYTPKADKRKRLADYFGVPLSYLDGEKFIQESESGQKYYFDDDTAEAAQKIFDNKELRILFDAAQDAEPEDLNALHAMLLALKRKERHEE